MNGKKILTGPSFEVKNNPEKFVFLLHGYGDNGENFISLSENLYVSSSNISFFAPNAPSSVPQYPIGRQWFDIYPNGIPMIEAGPREKEILEQDCLASLNLLKNYIDALCLKHQLTYKDCFIIGFSQGAIMAFELGKYINQIFAGCVLLSGRILPSENHNKSPFIKTPIMIAHGDQDSVIHPKYFDEACNILNKEGFLFESSLLKGEPHTISSEMLHLVQNFLKKNV